HHQPSRSSSGTLCAITASTDLTVALQLWVRNSPIAQGIGKLRIASPTVGFHVEGVAPKLASLDIAVTNDAPTDRFADLRNITAGGAVTFTLQGLDINDQPLPATDFSAELDLVVSPNSAGCAP